MAWLVYIMLSTMLWTSLCTAFSLRVLVIHTVRSTMRSTPTGPVSSRKKNDTSRSMAVISLCLLCTSLDLVFWMLFRRRVALPIVRTMQMFRIKMAVKGKTK